MKRSLAGMLMLCLAASTGCAQRNVYVKGDSQPVPLKTGQVAPAAGWLLSDAALADLLECCEARQAALATK